ncbi:MAG: hypothetical protein PF541_16860 [Prolixibacteraceae bacterium]|jgi:hypothetical protein|nr:hypothetical protein [Prolixibacteraceae bacterium]
MNKLLRTSSILSLLFIVIACSTANSAFKKGNYYDATLKAVKNLRNNPDSKKSLDLVKKSYPMALDYNLQKINQLSASNSTDKFLRIVESYTKLNDLADEISRCPAALEVLKPVVYFHKQLQKAETLAFNEQYDIGMALLDSENYSDARLALNRLNWVKNKQANYQGIDTALERAKQLAILKTVVEYKPENHSNYEINSYIFYKRLFDFVEKKASNQFTSFYMPEMAEDFKIKPHEVVSVQFLDFEIGQLYEREKEKIYESDSLIVGSYSDNKRIEYDVFGTVTADVITYEQEIRAKTILEIRIEDYQTGELILKKNYPGEYIWENQWVTFNGDSKAVPNHLLELTEQQRKAPPSPQEMFLLLSDPLFYSASSSLNSYYKKK